MDLCITCGNKVFGDEVYCSECRAEFGDQCEIDDDLPPKELVLVDHGWFNKKQEELEDLFKSEILDSVSTTLDNTIPF
jgi:hypothetical protein